ncbi:hypothetical protein [Streptomyces sp. NPDC001480]
MYSVIAVIVPAVTAAAVIGARALGRWPNTRTRRDRIQQVMRSPHH